ncbi:hypothetical protein [Halococcus sp. IIIV-5B]|uniref:hypothetical protein n=1 Tax=Halococcus sp. IIIV-5B TaxID=2321230 RepID=UPI001314E124|nr:hypothetical protein [Halococcus sp. IIIV-5B]
MFLQAVDVVELVVTESTDVVVKRDVLVERRCGSELLATPRTGMCYCDINSVAVY